MPNKPDLHSLVDSFVSDLTALTRRMALEQVLESLGGASASTPARRGPGRPPKSATPALPQKRAGGKRSAEDLGAMSTALLEYVKTNPGQRGEQIAAALGTDVGTMRLPMKKLIAEKQVRTEGQRRGMTYFAGAGRTAKASKSGRKPKKKQGS